MPSTDQVSDFKLYTYASISELPSNISAISADRDPDP